MSIPESSEIQAIFDRIAPVYDDLNFWLSLGQHRVWKLMAVKWADPQPGDRGLDICCGSGDLARLLARRVIPSGTVVGADFSAKMLAVAASATPLSEMGRRAAIEWVEGDALALPFADASFDCATMGYGLRNVTDIPKCLREIHRVLKPGAKAAILDFHRPRQPLLQNFQQWYLQSVVVPVAERYGLTEEYAYIMPSLERFPTGTQQVQLAVDAGFAAVHYPISGGMMGVLVLTKPEDG
ncbi:Demethylmenaquinone methyltransferase [Acaryochloris thomasi RCC1774]|uniref:2-phytyl-1,4-naphtoquinone methyltransferase n=1 Tax=Acaryochloris thomasi RCC1774 TaxID=1764569 RepID=A0A2W1JMK7_9CYAN|nr:bifunctional demethylmenaquinone methyltransferase/2-methoxy-6-polyprenyl-1,4-benzoquinol methylase UbiE [Acaryochloris thomasi]PZD71384.1 Demethylmenaquinone methyltransferase [Acaryochloris thomasi RCC1774]